MRVESGGGDVEWESIAPEEAEEGGYVADVGAISHLLPQIPSTSWSGSCRHRRGWWNARLPWSLGPPSPRTLDVITSDMSHAPPLAKSTINGSKRFHANFSSHPCPTIHRPPLRRHLHRPCLRTNIVGADKQRNSQAPAVGCSSVFPTPTTNSVRTLEAPLHTAFSRSPVQHHRRPNCIISAPHNLPYGTMGR
jgi:hypothetical protein